MWAANDSFIFCPHMSSCFTRKARTYSSNCSMRVPLSLLYLSPPPISPGYLLTPAAPPPPAPTNSTPLSDREVRIVSPPSRRSRRRTASINPISLPVVFDFNPPCTVASRQRRRLSRRAVVAIAGPVLPHRRPRSLVS